MRTTYLYGGVGNQLFQYFFLYVMDKEFKFSRLFLKNYRTQDSSLSSLLTTSAGTLAADDMPLLKRQLVINFIKLSCKLRINEFFNLKSDSSSQLFNSADARYFGYWQDASFFEPYREIIKGANWKHDVSFLSYHGRERVLERDTFVLHVRKADYLLPKNISIFADLGAKFYCDGFERLDRKITNLIICTDDKEWVTQNLLTSLEKYSDGVYFSDDFGCRGWTDDFLLMRFAQNLIMSNSTFSWWAAFLNDNNVYCPVNWFNDVEHRLKISNWNDFGERS